MYKIVLRKEASRNLDRLDKSIVRRIFRKLNWLATNASLIKPEGLRESLSGLSKLREGDYRVIYQILPEKETIVVRFIGHRSDVYKDR